MPDAQPAAPSPAAVEPTTPVTATDHAVVSGDVAAYREARRAERSGKPLDPKNLAAVADSATAQPAEQATPTGVIPQPASEPGAPEKIPPRKKDAESRKAELAADIDRLLRERRALADEIEREQTRVSQLRSPQPADVKPAASSPAIVAVDPSDPEPTLETFEQDPNKHPDAYGDWMVARAQWASRQEFKRLQAEDRARNETTKRRETIEQRNREFHARFAEAAKQDPEFEAHLSESVKGLRPTDALGPTESRGPLTDVADYLLVSPVGPQLMRHFSDHPEALDRFGRMATPAQVYFELGKLEATLTASQTPATPPPKTVTTAPEPPVTLGSRPAQPANEVEAAVVSGDVAAYRAARLRERVAHLR